MIQGLSGRIVLLLVAILFVGGTLAMRNQKPEVDDAVAEAQASVKGALGIQVERASRALKPAGLTPETVAEASGLKVLEVVPGSPAQHLGVRVGDRVLSVNEKTVWHAKQLDDALAEASSRGAVRVMLGNRGTYRSIAFGGGGGRPSGGPSGSAAPAPAPAGG